MDCYEANMYDEVEKKLNKAMPWVGLYIAAASAMCTLAIAADALNGFRVKKPCKYFRLNAASLTLLAVATKLPSDLNAASLTLFPKHVSLIFMSIAIAHFTSSLGSMNDEQIIANVVALAILVITTAANMCIQLVLLRDFLNPVRVISMLPTVLMMLSLATFVSGAITVPSMKRSLESEYQEKHRVSVREGFTFTSDGQRGYMMKYWVMAKSGSPEFVMARSVVSTTPAVICLFHVIILAAIYAVSFLIYGRLSLGRPESAYGRYTLWILVIQSIGVVVGMVSPLFRWFIAAGFKCSSARNQQSFLNGFKIEAHWIEALVDWRDCSSALHIQKNKYRKFLHDARWFAITFCIGLQTLFVLLSKLLLLLSALLLSRFSLCYTHSIAQMISNNEISGDEMDVNLTRYVLLLEGEAELPKRIVKNICREATKMIQMGKQKQPNHLVNLLSKFNKFQGVGSFDSDKIPSLHSEEPQNIWMLPVITLASIAVALPNIAKHKGEQLLRSMGEGLSLVKIVEKTLDKNAQLVNIRKSADVTWTGVVLYMKWLDVDLRRTSRNCNNSKDLVRELSRKAEKAIVELKREEKDSVVENPRNWRTELVCWNSMYRISRTILLSFDDEDEDTDEELFERLSVMIADIFAACLTNLPRVMTKMCHCNVIEEREKSVGDAFVLLGKTQRIVELLQQQQWPSLDHDKAAYIDEWRALFLRDEDNQADPGSTSGTASTDHEMGVISTDNHFPISLDT
ncbi:hypothetical protein ACS0TY_004703 [Phlomoides rotata]